MIPQLPHEILVHISTYIGGPRLMRELMLYRPFYEYFRANHQHVLQQHTLITYTANYIEYTVFGKRHREDGPAMAYNRGDHYWYNHGLLHREDGPAIIFADGNQYWYSRGRQHREDGPAIIYSNGRQCWYRNGERHREDGPAIIKPGGRQFWYLNGVETELFACDNHATTETIDLLA